MLKVYFKVAIMCQSCIVILWALFSEVKEILEFMNIASSNLV